MRSKIKKMSAYKNTTPMDVDDRTENVEEKQQRKRSREKCCGPAVYPKVDTETHEQKRLHFMGDGKRETTESLWGARKKKRPKK